MPFCAIRLNMFIFTFQSGYIQMYILLSKYCTLYCFTFQSGYIQIRLRKREKSRKRTLHSNLVIFKSLSQSEQVLLLFPLHSNLVIFKFCKLTVKACVSELYIPIWLYSNHTRRCSGNL